MHFDAVTVTLILALTLFLALTTHSALTDLL